MLACFTRRNSSRLPILFPLSMVELEEYLTARDSHVRSWLRSIGFNAKPGEIAFLPVEKGDLKEILVGLGDGEDRLAFGEAASRLPVQDYRLDPDCLAKRGDDLLIAWALGAYRFDRYKSKKKEGPSLLLPDGETEKRIAPLLQAIYLARDMINVPAEDMGPEHIAEIAQAIARKNRARIDIIKGPDLLKKNYPSIHAVGRASTRSPLLIDMRWGKSGPAVTLVGKGVCFDSGGLDIKAANYMQLMKKDMGGAALMLGLAQAIMELNLPLRLRLLIPAVDNVISGNAFRPLDVFKTRKGITIEIGNTDAEGRVILCDVLHEAANGKPDMIIDAATLTGAARIALGSDLPALFSNREDVAADLLRHGERQGDPLWLLPLYHPYRRMIESKVADITNSPDSSYAGAITAALFLNEFVPPDIPWMHIDTMAWNLSARPGRPQGGEAFAMRALLSFIQDRAAEKKLPAGKPAPRKNVVRRVSARRR